MMFKFAAMICASLLLVAGCGDQNPAGPEESSATAPLVSQAQAQDEGEPEASGGFGGVQIEMAGDDVVKIVIEAEDGRIEEPMAIYGDATPPEGVDAPQGASGGKYVETAESTEIDPLTGEKCEMLGGSTEVEFDVPESGNYYFWLRVWWRHTCANSFDVGLNGMPGMMQGMPPHQVTDNTCGVWRWMAIGPSVFEPAPIALDAGANTLKVASREDGSVLDQILVVDQADYVPTGVETAD